jgi:hypothetical protein
MRGEVIVMLDQYAACERGARVGVIMCTHPKSPSGLRRPKSETEARFPSREMAYACF